MQWWPVCMFFFIILNQGGCLYTLSFWWENPFKILLNEGWHNLQMLGMTWGFIRKSESMSTHKKKYFLKQPKFPQFRCARLVLTDWLTDFLNVWISLGGIPDYMAGCGWISWLNGWVLVDFLTKWLCIHGLPDWMSGCRWTSWLNGCVFIDFLSEYLGVGGLPD